MDADAFILVAGFWQRAAAVPWMYWLLWSGSLALSAALVFLLRTHWGQTRPLQKCAVLSLLVHLVLAFLAMTVRIVVGDGGGGGGAPIRVRIVREMGPESSRAKVVSEAVPEVAAPELLEPPRPKADAEVPLVAEEQSTTMAEAEPEPIAAPETLAKTDESAAKKFIETELRSTPAVQNVSPKSETPPTSQSRQEPTPSPSSAPLAAYGAHQDPTAPAAHGETIVSVATPYSLRNAPGRPGLIAGLGGSAETEAAVSSALAWLAAAQSKDGRWDANRYGAGREEMVLGQNRGGAGRSADTGVSALAILSFLGAGHTHLQGEYRDTVRRGLDFLLRSQATDGSIFGGATQYAQMYCHSMATFALAEAEAMTGDRRLDAAVMKSVNFSLRAQDSKTGSWRYRPSDSPGDTSQLGWQMMALASAERAGVAVPTNAWVRIDQFLKSVRRGTKGGLASYMPVSPTTTSMTAEALYCRLLLNEMSGIGMAEASAVEATERLLAELPDDTHVNLYCWYYATLALHHRHQANDQATAAWNKWNEALSAALMSAQVADGDEAGSWNTNTTWGGYGGRVYTTAMAAMCLEVYYRYAPAPPSAPNMAARPGASQSN
jgi:hypothetical protein